MGGDIYDDDDDDDNNDDDEDKDAGIKGLLPRTRCQWAQRSIDRNKMSMGLEEGLNYHISRNKDVAGRCARNYGVAALVRS